MESLRLHRPRPPLCPVTALAFFRVRGRRSDTLVVLAGEDNCLCVYDASEGQTDRCYGRLRVFAEQSIQGCRVSPREDGPVLVWGGRSVALIPRASIEELVNKGQDVHVHEVHTLDWIYDGLLPMDDSDTGALITAHNEVVPFRIGPLTTDLVLDHPLSPSRPVLYAAQLAWADPGRLVVSAGTVFGEILVWTCVLATASQPEVLHVFAGHEGSIFGVALSPELAVDGHTSLRVLVSCSDDRTIRAWPVRLDAGGASGTSGTSDAQPTVEEPRETGFYHKEDATATHQTDSLAVVMAHVSRIWHVRFGAAAWDTSDPSNSNSNSISLFSFGEDTATQEWRLVLTTAAETGLTGQFVHVRTLSGHVGKNIWAAAVQLEPTLVATGAADGKICLFSRDEGNSPAIAAVPQAESTSSTNRKSKREEVFHSYAFLSAHQLLAATNHGRLFLGSVEATPKTTTCVWSPVTMSPSVVDVLRDYNMVRAPGSHGLAVVGSVDGRLFLYSSAAGDLQELSTVVAGKVDDVLFLPDHEDGPPHLQMVISVLSRNEASALVIDIDIDTDTGRVVSEQSRPLTLPESPLPSSSPASITTASRCYGHLVLGSRRGQLLVYQDDSNSYSLVAQLQTGTRDAILSVVPLPPCDGQPWSSCSAFVATARDGTYRIYAIEKTMTTIALRLRHETATPFGPIVRDACFLTTAHGGALDLLLCGFRGTHFVVWNESRQHELVAVDCGSAHRVHACLLGPGGAVGFAFTRGSRLHVFVQPATAKPTIQAVKTGGHGREIRAAASTSDRRYVATGAEDTVVRIWGADNKCLAVLKRHDTGLHGLAWLGNDCLVSAAGAEELFVWRVAHLADSAYDGLAVLCESAYPDRMNNDKTLRVTGLDASADEEGLLISIGLSNSLLKTYRYDPADGSWRLLAHGRYTGACPTQVRHIRRPAPQTELVVLATFADGHLSVWRATRPDPDAKASTYTMVRATPVHRNAIKSLDMRWTESDKESMVVLTGGDDNAMAVTRLQLSGGGAEMLTDCTFAQTYRVASAHAAAVTGMCIVAVEEEDGGAWLTVVSSSNDQRVKAWRVRVEGDSRSPGVRIQLLDNQSSAVADPADLEQLNGEEGEVKVLVVGMGMETWSLANSLLK